jgi:hypothetical protein
MIANMNHAEFIAKLKDSICVSDLHRRFFTKRAEKYNQYDYRIKTSLGLIAVAGAVMAGTNHLRVFGAALAGGCAFILSSILPNFKWDSIVSGFKNEQEEWTRIFQGYDGLLHMYQILERDEMIAQEFQKVEELRKASQLNDRRLPKDDKLFKETELEVREYYRAKWGEIVILPLEKKSEK